MAKESVIAALRVALESNPDDLEVRLHLAELLLEDGNHGDADDYFQAALKIDPAHPRALRGAARAARARGETSRAAAYERILSAVFGSGDTPEDGGGADPPPKSPQVPVSEPTQPVRLRVVEQAGNVTVGPWEDREPVVTLADVGGMESVKKRLNMAFLAPLKNPDLVKMYGKSLKGGLMLYGPPGCGKTFIARALAGELGAGFMSIGLSDVLDMYLGESERKLHEIFETARRGAPIVLFFDEVDALGQKRSQLRHSAGRNVVNQLLAELDSVRADNRDVFVLAATNHPWDVDTALRRPGRLDRMVLVLPPDRPARVAILEYHLRDRPIEDIDLERIAARTQHFSGADLAHLCESAVEYAMEESLSTGSVCPITQADFARALAEIHPSTPPWFATARNYAMFANEAGVYDKLLRYINAHKL